MFNHKAIEHPSKMAISGIEYGEYSFQEIVVISAKTQKTMTGLGIKSGDSVLLALTPSPLLFGVISGLMGMGIRIIFIEPWLGLDRIQHILVTTAPKAFISGKIGKFWGIRSKAIRNIPHWVSPSDILNQLAPGKFMIENVSSDHHAFVVFSSGTMGAPKGVVRTHQYMQNIFDTFIAVEPETLPNPDLIIFPNVALFHLATGRGSVIASSNWKERKLKATLELCKKYKPQTLSTGPAFLKALVDLSLLKELNSLERIVIGGALTDCWLMEKLFTDLPGRKFLHIYGGSEAEPVSVANAEMAVKLSREKGYFQTLCLGAPIPQISHKFKDEILWVSGPNVSGEYIGSPEQNHGIKERDLDGKLWHCMGDRVTEENGTFWMMGRQNQLKDDFLLEQALYSKLASSKLFLHRLPDGKLILIGENIKSHQTKIRQDFPQITDLIERKIVRDQRHRSRIDRKKSLPSSLRPKE